MGCTAAFFREEGSDAAVIVSPVTLPEGGADVAPVLEGAAWLDAARAGVHTNDR